MDDVLLVDVVMVVVVQQDVVKKKAVIYINYCFFYKNLIYSLFKIT
jgi:hypothetical protein